MSANGWVKLHRQFVQWEWFTDQNTLAVFIYLMCMANHKAGNRFRGVDLLPGQLITGRHIIAKETGLSEQNVRTSLKRLKSTNELTIKPTNKFSLITLNNWAKYQFLDDVPTNKTTNKAPTTNQQLTTFKNVNNEIIKEDAPTNLPEWVDWMHQSQIFQEQTIMAVMHLRKITFAELADFINRFAAKQIAGGRVYGTTNEARSHFVNWLHTELMNQPAVEPVRKLRKL